MKKIIVLSACIACIALTLPAQTFAAPGRRGEIRHHDDGYRGHSYGNRDYRHRGHEGISLSFGVYRPYYLHPVPFSYPEPAPVYSVRVEQSVSFGEVLSVSDVTINSSSGALGSVTGGAIGAVLGNSVGGGAGKAVATIAGAVAGAITGNAIEKQAASHPGQEITVRLDNGRTVAIIQEKNESILAGDRVMVIRDPNGTSRVRRTTSRNEDALTINIPNADGGYTPVTLNRSKNGYTGPQGEFYPDHPTVEQLRILYGE